MNPDYHDAIPDLVQRIIFAADDAAIATPGTMAEKVRRAVEASIRAALANGLITIVSPDSWPSYMEFRPYSGLPS